MALSKTSFLILGSGLFLFGCKEKVAFYSAKVINERGEIIEGAKVLISKNGEMMPVVSSKGINDAGDYTEDVIKSDSEGKINVAFSGTDGFLKSDEYKIYVIKSGYDTANVEIEWKADLENEVVLHAGR